ncbi:MAG: UvrD-helicase domain-containing protein [Bacteroidales bacterium]|nr:UvrD-helicase domain-containing protein [Bacteroidales bacterium]
MDLDSLFKGLNKEQQSAVKKTDGPLMVIAGAGSGKTRVLTYRIAYLLQKGVDPFHILALTFTNKAAREMKSRIGDLVGFQSARNVWMGTFHSVFARILRAEAEKLGYPSNFTIYDTDDSKNLIKAIVKEGNLDPKIYQASQILGRISAAKNNLISAEGYNQNSDYITDDKKAGKPYLGQIYTIYQRRLAQSAAMDFDDLLFKINVLLRDFPEVLYKYQQKFHYVLVDEYQDTNYSQYLIVKKLAANNENICVVGDDAQSIYGFRGADIKNILNFQKDYPDVNIVKLEQNYRSTQVIVNAANSLIHNNQNQIFKTVWTSNGEGERIKLLRASSDLEEGRLVAQQIFEDKMNFLAKNSEFAVLYRTNAQSRSIEEALRKMNIPYRIYGGLSFYKRKEIKDVLAYFRLVINTKDNEAFNRIINFPARGIGKTTLEHITIAASKYGKSYWDIIEQPNTYGLNINSGAQKKLNDFVLMIKSFQAELEILDAFELGNKIARGSGLISNLHNDKTPEGISRFENLEALLNGIKEFVEREESDIPEIASDKTLADFMQDVALLTDADEEDKDTIEKVSLMTIHQSKGLEFPYVSIVGLEENLFPSVQSVGSRADLEEERRLFYVALTRAEKKVVLSYAESRFRWGNLSFCEPSRFVDEIEEQFLDFPRSRSFAKPSVPENPYRPVSNRKTRALINKPSSISGEAGKSTYKRIQSEATGIVNRPTSNFKAAEIEDLQQNMDVEHQRFGLGKIIKIEGAGSNKKATVYFSKIGEKQLLLRFAKLRIVK